ncbi:MAG: hypothetical protein AVDCRST_MAG19-1347 [uncultured Thermomicrobiales bacterium]|uniref:DUF4870 domain-containing protein n=1 Tax=uncultured Thermomicrobiales bacterium TaxID=1645740 RepID=A0A6J4UTE8_9BACT|nr:MAG: hypothetical protein AVDCRST_MAG19-1347 [uncultured Thermomicrobiales bacterium]
MNCRTCGHRAGLDDLFCAHCGADVRHVAPAPATPLPGATGASTSPDGEWHLVPERESRNWAMGAHVSALLGGFMGGVPAFLGPLVIWLMRRKFDAYAAAHARAAFNFHLSVLIYVAILIVVTVLTFGLGVLLTLPALVLLGLAWLVLTVLGIVRAADDRLYRYPLAIPFLR